MKRIGLVVNPIAGLGGPLALKGSDDPASIAAALARKFEPQAASRAGRALTKLAPHRRLFRLIAAPGAMGEDSARLAGLDAELLPTSSRHPGESRDPTLPEHGSLSGCLSQGRVDPGLRRDDGILQARTTRSDTQAAARLMEEANVDLLLFAGGDGTARDIVEVLGARVPLLGIPSGVKMHSGVFATSPEAAGQLAANFMLAPERIRFRQSEIMDVDEQQLAFDRISARLYGYSRTPYERHLVQNSKARGSTDDHGALEALAREFVSGMERDVCYIIGPGTTTKLILAELGLEGTLLGVDVVRNGELIGSDVDRHGLETIARKSPIRIVVAVIGGQGCVFGRGNQQIGPDTIRRAGCANIFVLASEAKLLSLEGGRLFVDTGDPDLDRSLSGYIRVLTAPGRSTMMRIA